MPAVLLFLGVGAELVDILLTLLLEPEAEAVVVETDDLEVVDGRPALPVLSDVRVALVLNQTLHHAIAAVLNLVLKQPQWRTHNLPYY